MSGFVDHYDAIASKGLEVNLSDPPQPWKIEEVPPAGSGSRFAVNSSREGWEQHPAEVSAGVYVDLVTRFERSLTRPEPERVTFNTKRVRLVDITPTYDLIDAGDYTGVVELEPLKRDGKFKGNPTLSAGALLDACLLGEIPREDPTDGQLYDALLDHCRAVDAAGRVCRDLSETLTRFIALRRGVVWRGSL